MRILITGATGLIGTEIVAQCHKAGIAVNYLTTSKSKIENKKNYQGYYWNPSNAIIDVKCLENVDVIIHLVGASISKRWTKAHKQAILNSRLKTTALLHDTVKNNPNTIKQIVSASAIGYYPDSLTNYYTEDEKNVNTSFLGQVVEVWEQAVDTFKTLNITVSKIRIGVVFSKEGGAFPQLAKPIKYGAGAVMGNGKQWMSWIHLHDLAAIFLHVAKNKLEGIYNGVSPNPETNKSITKSIARHLKKPLILPNIPKIIMKIVLGEMHIILFESQRVSSKKIENTGFNFEFPNLKSALNKLL
ncbi:TIGR01777 family oxidoreductase [Lacinutrix sp. MedPE-SW]|uniref:TIGR01777 family oxidoreductase n=1 Tax=Lacinutrix sp. MedPE-SW TaxID=1860087 RepID=UPI000911C35F|nr:TIGR01777 family oxidoreductase [Lacinutrix sp. MedPE-SW]OIQ19413.1 MAG: TIGR01777 family protein [Lacinutrix sp. MedPE-SW]